MCMYNYDAATIAALYRHGSAFQTKEQTKTILGFVPAGVVKEGLGGPVPTFKTILGGSYGSR